MAESVYDLVALGTGGAAVKVATACREAGWRVAIVDALDLEAGGDAVENGRPPGARPTPARRLQPGRVRRRRRGLRGPQLTPVATHDAECVARNLLEGCRHEPDHEDVASTVLAIAPLASVGLTEEDARGRGLDVEVHAGDMAGYQPVRRVREEAAAFKVVMARGTRRVLGPEAEGVINLLALAVRLGLPAPELGRLLSAYPSGASNIAGMLK